MLRFDNQVALVTGSGRGLGAAYARLLARRGARVVVHDAGVGLDGQGGDHSIADGVVQEISAAGGQAVATYENLGTRENCQRVVQTALEHFGRLDVLISNAGWVARLPLEEMTPDVLARMVEIHIAAPLWLAQAALPIMQRQGYGRVVLTSSGIGLATRGDRPELAGYAIGKSAQLGLMNALTANALDLNIRVNIVSPVAATRVYTGTADAGTLLPEQVAPGVIFLASEACSVSGAILSAVNGRFSIMRWQRGPGIDFGAAAATPEDFAAHWPELAADL